MQKAEMMIYDKIWQKGGNVKNNISETQESQKSMISWDVINGLARRSWARNDAAISTVSVATELDDRLNVTMRNMVDSKVFEPSRVVDQAIQSATETAVMILRIDDVISSRASGPMEGGDFDGMGM